MNAVYKPWVAGGGR